MDKYLLPKVKNTVTNARLKTQDLTGARFTLAQRDMAQEVADQYATKLTERTGDLWVGYVEEYIPSQRLV